MVVLILYYWLSFYFSEVESTLFTGDHSSGPTEGELDNSLMGPTECYLSLLVAAGFFCCLFFCLSVCVCSDSLVLFDTPAI